MAEPTKRTTAELWQRISKLEDALADLTSQVTDDEYTSPGISESLYRVNRQALDVLEDRHPLTGEVRGEWGARVP